MDDLSHWDFAEHFSGYDAAALILGLEPRESEADQHRVHVVEDRMKLHYDYAFETLKMNFLDSELEPFGDVKKVERSGVELRSVIMNHLEAQAFFNDAETPLHNWIFSKQTQFQNQEFDRQSIVKWLSAIGMKSVYQFDKSQPPAIENVSGRWPWGDHHTELLGHLEAAARRYWVNYEPTDATTAPTNKDVAEWLVTERKVSQKMAESIASMLRPDGLATGPRK